MNITDEAIRLSSEIEIKEKELKDLKLKRNQITKTKFIMVLTSEVKNYIEWKNRDSRLPKAEIVREAIENMMYSDIKYKRFIRDER